MKLNGKEIESIDRQTSVDRTSNVFANDETPKMDNQKVNIERNTEKGILNKIIPPMLIFFVIGTLISILIIPAFVNMDMDNLVYGVVSSLVISIALTAYTTPKIRKFLLFMENLTSDSSNSHIDD